MHVLDVDYPRDAHADRSPWGKRQLFERVRTVKAPAPRSNDKEPSSQVVQRLRAEFPATAPVDAILQRMIGLGLDRVGNNGSRREAVIRFTIADLGVKLPEMLLMGRPLP